MKEEIKNAKILEKTVRRENGKILKRVQDDMVVQGDIVVQDDVVVQDDMGMYGHCERMRSNPANYFARSADKVFSLFTSHLSQRCAFTLAEVLITLGIIGVVAALTMPTLVQNYKKKVVETRLAKFYSVMNNAIRMAEAYYGPQDTWSDYYETDEYDDDHNISYEKGGKYDTHVNKYFAPYLKIAGSEEIRDVAKGLLPQKVYYLADGSAFSFNLHENREIIFYPFNNIKKCLQRQQKDIEGSCMFTFAFIPTGSEILEYKYNFSNGMQPALLLWDGNEDSLMSNTTKGCKDGNGGYCTEIIRRNGWKIPKDYPRKF